MDDIRPQNKGGSKKVSPIKSYSNFKLIQNYFLERGQIRDYTLFTVGICSGLRISDLINLKISDILAPGSHLNFRQFINITEEKTGKKSSNAEDQCLITEAMKKAFLTYFNSYNYSFKHDDYVFKSQRPNGNGEYVLTKESAHRIMKKAQRDLDLPYSIGTHTFRRTFGFWAFCLPLNIDIDTNKLEFIQMCYKHSSVRTTMGYIGISAEVTNMLRENVSNFALGKYTDIDELKPF